MADRDATCDTKGRARLAVLPSAETLYPFLLAACTMVLVPLAIAMQRSAGMAGDAPFYIAMQQALIQHGWPSLPPGVLGILGEAAANPGAGGEGRLIRSTDGAVHAVHFWFYPLLTLPFAAAGALFGMPAAYAFVALNIALYVLSLVVLHRSSVLHVGGKCVVLVSFSLTSIVWYVAWPHPEVFTASLLLISSLLLLERRYGTAALSAAVASLQNPSAMLMLLPIGLAILAGTVLRDRGWLAWERAGWHVVRLLPACAVAAVPYLYAISVIGVLNPIVANGYVDLGQITAAKFASLMLDPNQGFVIGFPFVMTVLAVVVWLRCRGATPPLQVEDVLLLGVAAMAVPVLTQINFNAGQYYASRYVAWLAVPAVVWVALQVQRHRAAGIAFLLGLLLYAVNFALFMVQKLHYVLTVVRAGGPTYEDHLILKPLAALLLTVWPGAYAPWPEIFIERVLAREMPRLAPRPTEFEVVGFSPVAGRYTVVMTTTPDESVVRVHLCGSAGQQALSSMRFSPAGAGYFIGRGHIDCQPRGQGGTP